MDHNKSIVINSLGIIFILHLFFAPVLWAQATAEISLVEPSGEYCVGTQNYYCFKAHITYDVSIHQVISCSFEEPDVDYIIDRYIEARGGLKKIKDIESKIYRGHYIEPGYNLLLNAQVKQKRPYFRVVGDTSIGFAEGYDGSSWEYSRSNGFIRTTGEAEAATRRGSEFDESLIEYKSKGHDVELLGQKIINGSQTYEIELTLNDGWKKIYYIDTSSYLIIALRKAMPLHARGDDIDYLVTVTDYREVNDVLFPFTQIERDFHSNKMISATIWDTLLINNEIPDSVFSFKPSRD